MDIQICISNPTINYNKWITLPATVEELKEVMNTMDKYPEYYHISSHTGSLDINPHDDILALNDFVSDLSELGERGQLATLYLIEAVGLSREEALENQERVQVWQNSNLEDVAYNLVEEGAFGRIPSPIINYIDYEKIIRDLRMDGYYYDGKHVFYYI